MMMLASSPNPVPGVDHFSRTLLGHFWGAAKPFNSQATYNVLFRSTSGERSRAQIEAFDDTWHWGDEAELAFDGVISSQNAAAAEMLRSMRAFLKENDVIAYLCMMAVRLLELHRALKPTGCIYLHCDPTASHYLKILMDAIFGTTHFKNEIIWKRTSAHSSARRYGPVHDVLLFYAKTDSFSWRPQYTKYDEQYLDTFFDQVDSEGRHGSVWISLEPVCDTAKPESHGAE